MRFLMMTFLFSLTLMHAEIITDNVPPSLEVITPQSEEVMDVPTDLDEEESFDDEFGDDFSDEGFDEDSFGDEYADEEEKKEVFDPLSGVNRAVSNFNDALYRFILDPVLFKGYNYVPEPVRESVNNFFENLYFPVSVVNNVFQLKFKSTGTETLRFTINSTIGVLGLFDPAQDWFGIEAHQEDFGQTLGYYGVGGGFHIVLPFFGPTNLRDLAGDFIDFYVNPIYYVDVRKYNIVNHTYQGWMLIGYKQFNKMSLYQDEYDNVRRDALDLYPFMRDLYENSRQRKIEE